VYYDSAAVWFAAPEIHGGFVVKAVPIVPPELN
jgi:hypothetical protein